MMSQPPRGSRDLSRKLWGPHPLAVEAARRVAIHPIDREDAVQEAWLRVITAGRAGHTELPYLRRVALNAARNARRTLYRQFRGAQAAEDRAAPHDDQAVDEPADVRHATRERDEVVRAWVRSLPSLERQVFRALYEDGCSQRDAAALIGVSQARISQIHTSILARGRIALRAL